MSTKRLSDMAPFKMHGSIYFVGASAVSVHVIKTDEGLVMIDTGYPDMLDQIQDSMNELGLCPKDLCAIFHTHGHIDHIGCTLELQKLSGAKTYISRIDNDITNGTLDLSWAKELHYDRLPPFNCDVLLEDGDAFTFGRVTIHCIHTPGHTDGVMSFLIEDKENGFSAAMHGGIGLNTLTTDFLNAYHLPFTCRDDYRNSLHKLRAIHPDFVLGNHPSQNKTDRKYQKVLAGESILDQNEWPAFLDSVESWFESELAEKACFA